MAQTDYGVFEAKTPADVIAELERREGMSGLEEKALRKARGREGAGE